MITQETRREAFEAVKPKAQTRRETILSVLREYPDGLTAEELTGMLYRSGQIISLDRNYVKPRLTELRKLGIIEPCGKRESRTTGIKTAVWRIKNEHL